MKNKLLIGIVTFFCTLFLMIIVMDLLDVKTKKVYTFDRKFDLKNQVLQFEKKYEKTNLSDHVMHVNSDNYIVERDMRSIDDKNNKYDFYFEDFDFQNKKKLSIVLPKGANVIFCNLDKVIFTSKFDLFEYNLGDNKISKIEFEDLKISCIEPIINSETKFICLAQYFKNNSYKTGFYLIDFKTREIKLSKELQVNKTDNFLANSLQYIGKFTYLKEKNTLAYCCEKYSKIYLFDNQGNHNRDLETLDKVPLPKIAQNQEGNHFYSRDGTWYSNMGVFAKGNYLFIFSAATEDKNNITIDKYAFDNLKYVKSYKLVYNNINSNNIMNLYLNNNKIILCLDFNYASFSIL